MERFILLLVSSVALAAGNKEFATLYPAAEIRDQSTLNLVVSEAREYHPRTAPDRLLKRIDLTFTSFAWSNETWRHPCTLLLPDKPVEEFRGTGAIVAGNDSFDRATGPLARYVEDAALMGVPVLFIGGNNPGKHYGGKDEGRVMAIMDEKFFETGDLRWIGFAALAKVMLRAATAMQAIPETHATRFVITGSSKRGEACWLALAGDDRIAGAYALSWNAANAPELMKIKAERWGLETKGPGAGPGAVSAGERLSQLKTSNGELYRRVTDPYAYRDQVGARPVLFSAGTNDPLFPAVSDRAFLPGMPESVRILLQPNRGHPPGTEEQAAGWRMWLAHVFAGRPVPSVAVKWEDEAGSVIVKPAVKSGNRVRSVTVWYASDEKGSYLESKWASVECTRKGEGWSATIPAARVGYTAFFADVEDLDARWGRGFVTSGMQEVKR